MDASLQKVFSECVIHMERQTHNPVDLYICSSGLQSGNNDIFLSHWTMVFFEALLSIEGQKIPFNQNKCKIIVNINETKYNLKVLFS